MRGRGVVLMFAAGSTYTTSVERLQGTVQGQGRPGTGTGGGGGAGSDWKAWVCSRTTRVTTAETNTKAAVAMMMRARVGSAKSCRQTREMLVSVGGGGAGGGACQVPQVSGLLPFLPQPLLKRYDPCGTCKSGRNSMNKTAIRCETEGGGREPKLTNPFLTQVLAHTGSCGRGLIWYLHAVCETRAGGGKTGS